ncbi:hypothetical protein GDO86_003792 [Hymenochirus boettgeri]|uniref:THAP-type domain-containing protein n=1 Tax=Hymenochirus boettgeri TaxID=247094 RepID=A0A8T2K5G0_9PIPI|nr:hypothetical protein GDO86_003792 [Hymenochirus boettgeri]
MIYCFVKACSHKGGQKHIYPDIVFHSFPHDMDLIRNWLMQTGQKFINLEEMVQKIYGGVKANIYRICSAHFTSDQYIMKGSRRVLSPNAVPTIFPSSETSTSGLYQINVPAPKRKRVEDDNIPSTTSTVVRIMRRLVTVSTQTDLKMWNTDASVNTDYWSNTKDKGIQVNTMGTQSGLKEKNVKQRQVLNDHYYGPISFTPLEAVMETESVCKTETKEEMDILPISELPLPASIEQLRHVQDVSFGIKVEHADRKSLTFSSLSETSINFTNTEEKTYVSQRKYIVFEDNITQLLHHVKCQFNDNSPCNKPIVNIEKNVEGTMVTFTLRCLDDHVAMKWSTQPVLKKAPVGNLMMAASILFSGSSFTKVKELFDLFGVESFGKSSYYKYQQNYLFPAIHRRWSLEKKEIDEDLKGRAVVLAGDGQFDCTGHSAKYFVYSLQDQYNDKIVDFHIEELCPDKPSVVVKKTAFEKCLENLLKKNVDVRVVATDRPISIRKFLSTTYPEIEHQVDVWHLAKSVSKQLVAASKKRGCSDLKTWITPIINHLLWCAQSCEQDQDKILDKWKSVMFHIANKHTFPSLKHYKKCGHGPIENSDNIVWINSRHRAHETLQKIIFNPRLLKDLKHVTRFCHTGSLEVFHNKVLKYRPKTLSYDIDAMDARTILAILSHNHNIRREQATIKVPTRYSDSLGEKRFRSVFPKQQKDWIAKPVLEAVVDDHLYDLIQDALDLLSGEITFHWASKSSHVPENVLTKERPPKKDILAKHMSRFNR